MSQLLAHAKAEFDLAGVSEEERKEVMELLECFARQGHSGGSAPITLDVFHKLAMYKPLSEITDANADWQEVAPVIFQSRRLSSLFKDALNPGGYFIDAIVWVDQNGTAFTGTDVAGYSSHQRVQFPFVPKTFEVGVIDTDGSYSIASIAQLHAALSYYQGARVG